MGTIFGKPKKTKGKKLSQQFYSSQLSAQKSTKRKWIFRIIFLILVAVSMIITVRIDYVDFLNTFPTFWGYITVLCYVYPPLSLIFFTNNIHTPLIVVEFFYFCTQSLQDYKTVCQPNTYTCCTANGVGGVNMTMPSTGGPTSCTSGNIDCMDAMTVSYENSTEVTSLEELFTFWGTQGFTNQFPVAGACDPQNPSASCPLPPSSTLGTVAQYGIPAVMIMLMVFGSPFGA